MKVRIIKKYRQPGSPYCRDDTYVPQFRLFGIWITFSELGSDDFVARNTLEQAEDWVHNYAEKSDSYITEQLDKPYKVVRKYTLVK